MIPLSNSRPVSEDNMHKYASLGLNIAFYRKRAGLTQEQLADRAGISRAYLSIIEAPNTIRPCSLEILFSIADALNVPPWDLMRY